MRFRLLVAGLGVVLAAAIGFSLWAPRPELPPAAEPPLPPPSIPVAPAPIADRPTSTPPPPAPVIAAPTPPPVSPPPAPTNELGTLDPEPDPQVLNALGIPESAIEPEDGGVLSKLDRAGIQGAIKERLPEIRECYDSWLQQNPQLGGRLKVEFRINEIPGRERGKVTRVEIADGGLGHVAFEGCVGNVFKDLRFEAPRGGEMRVTYPLVFSAGDAPKEKGATPN